MSTQTCSRVSKENTIMDVRNEKTSGRAEKKKRSKPENDASNEKKPFDKKKYRLKKYSHKYKVDQWEDRRKKAVLRTFYKDLRKDEASAKILPLKPAHEATEESSDKKKPKSPFFAAKREFEKKKAEKLMKREKLNKIKAEREEALSKYREKKMQAYRKLSKKTKKGQPVMKDRLEMLLEKIKESTGAQ